MPSFVTGSRAVATAHLIATLAHAGQADKAGSPYIDHARRVVGHLNRPTWQEVTVAWLHDVVEDTPVTVEAVEQTFGPVIAAAVDAISHRPHEPRDIYYARVKDNSLALAVKVADIADNTDPDRLSQLDDITRRRLGEKYSNALRILLSN